MRGNVGKLNSFLWILKEKSNVIIGNSSMNIFFILEYGRVKKHIKACPIKMLKGKLHTHKHILFWLFNSYFTCSNESAKKVFILAFLLKNVIPTYLGKKLNHYSLQY